MSYSEGFFPNGVGVRTPYIANPAYSQPASPPYGYGMPQTPYYPGSTRAMDYQQQMAAYQQQQQQAPLKGRPVSSIEEARAAQIDFDGSLFIFPNIGGNEIYTRKLGQDGRPVFNVYSLACDNETGQPTPQPPPAQQTPDYVTREQLNKSISELKKAIENDVLDIIASAEGAKHDGPK